MFQCYKKKNLMISSIDTHHKPQKDVKKVFHGLEGPAFLEK